MFTRATAIRRGVTVLALPVCLVAVSSTVHAQSDSDEQATDTPLSASPAVGAGAFSPFTMGARGDTQRALGFFLGGYDSARRGGVFQAGAEAQLWGRMAVRAGGSYLGPSGTLHPEAALKVDALRQEQHGVDMAAAVGYEAQGFNLTPAVVARIAVGRTLDHTRLTANVGYGAGTRADERYGDLRLAAIQELSRNLHLGLDSRFRIDLERDNDEPAGEAEWELKAGPMAALSMGRLVLSAGGGASAVKYRFIGDRTVGLYGLMGLGAVF